MKITTISCDTCGNEILKEDGVIMVGSESGSEFCFSNKLRKTMVGEVIRLSHHKDLHFCTKNHFVDYFFNLTETS